MKTEEEIRERLAEQEELSKQPTAGTHAQKAKAYDQGFIDALE